MRIRLLPIAAFALFACDPEPPPPAVVVPVKVEAAQAQAIEAEPARKPDEAMMNLLLGKSEPAQQAQAPAPKPRRRVTRVATPDETWDTGEPAQPSLSDEQFHAVVGSWSGMKHCLTTGALAKDEQVTGAISVSLKIGGDGSVLESHIADATTATARAISPCVERHSKKLKFPAFGEDAEPVTREAKFVF